MKHWVATVLLVISIACSITPCCQFDDCAGDELSNKQPDHKNEDKGACSPFFSCTTCSGFTQSTKPISVPALAEQQQTHCCNNLIAPLSDFARVFWQPPRLS